jgi:hypothetical protein
MADSLKQIHDDLEELKRDMARIKAILEEDFELSEWAKKRIEEAKKTAHSEYISQNDIEKEFL